MSKDSRMMAACFVIFVFLVIGVATFVQHFLNGLTDKGFPSDNPTDSVVESQEKGVFVCKIKQMPRLITWHGRSIQIVDSWIEHKAKTRPYFVWWKTVTYQNGYLCVMTCTFSEPAPTSSFLFIASRQSHSFVSEGYSLFFEDLSADAFRSHNLIVELHKGGNGWRNPLLSFQLDW